MKIIGILLFLIALVSLGANDVGPTKSELEAMYAAAAAEVNAGRYGAALKQLDAIDARQPDLAAAKNLRGVALMRMGNYGPAEKALQKAREFDPNLWEARFNLAEVPFLRKNWAEARHRYEELAKAKGEQVQGATGDLIQFKILLTWLLQGKEKQAAEILNNVQESTVSPVYYFGKAAFAFRHKDETEARVALKAAEKTFSPELNRLFRESFYETGWLEKPEGALPVALEVSSLAERAAKAQADYGKAERAYRAGEYDEALQLLDQVDAAAPNQALSYNLRGEVLLAQGQADAAEAAFRNALAADAQFAEARLNLARVPFQKGDYETARKELESLLGATAGNARERRREQLIRYQIFLTLLREGHEAAAQKAMDEFKMMDETPALYYAQAAWAFQHGNFKQGNNWVANANNLYPAEINQAFAAPIADLGWLKGAEATLAPNAEAVVAGASPSPTAERSAAPFVAKNENSQVVATPEPSPTPAPAEKKETPAPVVAERKAAEPTPSAAEVEEPSPTPQKIAEAREETAPEGEIADSPTPKKKSVRRAARSRSDQEEEKPRRKRATAGNEEKRPAPLSSPAEVPVAPAAEPVAAPHQNLGDKVARLLLYPFRHRKEKEASPAPAEPVSGPTASATPTPKTRRSRSN